jgi:hypothetical protein
MKKLKGTDFLRLNLDIKDKTQDPKVAREALKVLKDLAPSLGLPGTYLSDSLERFLGKPKQYRTLEQAFGLESVVGPPVVQWSDKDAEIAYKCFEKRLKGKLAKQLEYKGFSKRKLTAIQGRYLWDSIARAKKKRGKKGFNEDEAKRLEQILARGRRLPDGAQLIM